MEFSVACMVEPLRRLGFSLDLIDSTALRADRRATSVLMSEEPGRLVLYVQRPTPRAAAYEWSAHITKLRFRLDTGTRGIAFNVSEHHISASVGLPDGFLEVEHVLEATELLESTTICASSLLSSWIERRTRTFYPDQTRSDLTWDGMMNALMEGDLPSQE